MERLVGVGSFGVVGQGKKIQHNEKVAIKLIIFNGNEQIKQEIEEIELIKVLNSEWIVKYVDKLIEYKNKYLFIITEFC